MALRKYRDGGRIPIPADTAPPPAEAPADVAAEAVPVAVPADAAPAPDNALADQLARMRAAQELAQQQAREEHERVEAELARQMGDDDPVAMAIDSKEHLSARQRDWLKGHRDAFTDQAKNAYLGAAHWDAIRAGHQPDSDGYFAAIEETLGYRQATTQASPPARPSPEVRAAEPPRRSVPMSAPVSREAPDLSTGRPVSTRIELSPAEREAARFSGVSETEYAANKLRLANAKKLGMYQERG